MLLGKQIFGVEIRRRHLMAALALLATLALVLAWTLLPSAGLRWGLVKALRGFGMVEVSVSDADLSLFRGNLVVRKMVARPPLGSALGIKDFTLRFRWAPLLDKRVVLDRVALEGMEIDIHREGGGFVVNGLPLAVAAAPPGQPAGSGTEWGIDVASLELTDSRLVLTDGDARAEIAVTRLTVENLHSRDPGSAPAFTLLATLNGATIEMKGRVSPFADEPSFSLEAVLRRLDLAQLRAIAAKAGASGLGGRVDVSLTAAGALRDAGLTLRASGRLEGEGLSLGGPLAVSAERLAVDLRRLEWDAGRLDLAGRLDAAALAVKAAGGEGSAASLALDLETLALRAGRLDLVGSLDAAVVAGKAEDGSGSAATLKLGATKFAMGDRLDWQGSLGLTGLRIAAAGFEAQPDSLAWAGGLDLALGSAPLAGRAEGRLELGPLRLALSEVHLGHKHAVAEGWVEFGHAGKVPVTAGLKLTAEGLTAGEPSKRESWLALERLDLAGIAMTPNGVASAERLSAAGLAALKRDGKAGYPWRVEARSLRLDHLSRNADGDLALADARLDGLIARLTRTKDGLLGMPASQAKPQDEDEPPGIALGRLTVGGNSRLVFEDRSADEAVRLEAQAVELVLSDLDSDHPDRDSGFDLKARIGEGRIVASGVARPFAEPMSGRLDGRITALELPPLSPYLAEALGVHLHTGHFDGSFKGGAVKGVLDGKLDVDLSNLFIAPPDPNAPIIKKMEMPIETVLNLLRDGDDRIRLSLPVRGNLDNPDLDVSDAVAQAVAGALKSTVLTTLKLAFPVATLISMVVDAEDQSRLALAPLAFATGSDIMSDDHRKTLAGIAELMRERPSLKLTLCGKAEPADWPALVERQRAEAKPLLTRLERMIGAQRRPEDAGPINRDALGGLAENRAETAKEFLVDSAGIDAGRLFACRAEVEVKNGKGPRVELLL
ncbi:MAG: DUF748 domain-containing protein [Phaeospirillum sp.]|nr:DUF748 domain-containing protein [Phaeospirillum sp.]